MIGGAITRAQFAKALFGVPAFAAFSTLAVPVRANAEQPVPYAVPEGVERTLCKFDESWHYEFSSEWAEHPTGEEQGSFGIPLGSLSLTGDVSVVVPDDGVGQMLVVEDGLDLVYAFDRNRFTTSETSWHLIDDASRDIDDFSIGREILKGAAVVQSSFDGKKWFTNAFHTNIFADDAPQTLELFSLNDILLSNDCLYRVVVVYKLQRLVGTDKVAFVVTTPVYETSEFAEVYEFRAIGRDAYLSRCISDDDVDRVQLGQKARTDAFGYTNERPVVSDDPHFSWDLGSFYMGGYAAYDSDSKGSLVFYKTVGNQMVLWFSLEQDIDNLPGENSPAISRDTDGCDEALGVPKSDFGRGTLIVRKHDSHDGYHAPVVYTDFLDAYASPAVDTRIQLNEEGEYEVALDYEIKRGGFGPIPPEYFNYRIAFEFEVRNGNSMVFPMEIGTGSELHDGDYTQSGFVLDLANSQNLTVTISRSVLVKSGNGTFICDVRFNKPAAAGEEYSEPGIYAISVQSEFSATGATTKTIYVGGDAGDANLRLLSENRWTVDELNEHIATDGA